MSTPTYVKKYATVVVDEVVLSPTEIAIVIDSASQIVASQHNSIVIQYKANKIFPMLNAQNE